MVATAENTAICLLWNGLECGSFTRVRGRITLLLKSEEVITEKGI